MKFATVSACKSLVLGLALMLATSAFAATKGSLQLSNPVQLNGTTIKPGSYSLQWEGAGPNVELSIMQGKNLVAKVSARMVDLTMPAAYDAALTVKNSNGPNTLSGVRFQGKKFGLDLGEASSEAPANSSK
jgi:hypothetical protein